MATPVNFRIYNETDSTFIKFIYVDNDANGVVSYEDEIVFVEMNPTGKLGYTWDIAFSHKLADPNDTVYALTTGDKLVLKTFKSLRHGDTFEFVTTLPKVDEQKATLELQNVRVVPNPYVTAAEWEPPLNPGITSGRGTRRIEFIHLPMNATVKIFTARGDHLVTLYHDGSSDDGSVSWNLKTKENLDIAYGIYFYVVESPVGNKTGKIAIIK